MTAHEFCYWLQGFFEMTEAQTLDHHQAATLKRHLNMVFIHEIDEKYPANQQKALNEAHTKSQKSPHPIVGGGGSGEVTFRC